MTVILVSLSLPAHVVFANGTTVEVNSGNAIILNEGEVISGSGTAGIPVAVKGLPDMGAPLNGLAAFQFDFTWHKDVIHVDSVFAATSAGWTAILPGTLNNTDGTASVAGFTTTFSTDDIILFYLGVHAVGSRGDSTSIDVAITSLYDKDNITILATSVSALVKIVRGTLVSIAVIPADPTIALGLEQQFAAWGNYDDGSRTNITDVVTWTSTSEARATIQTKGDANPGLANSLAVGKTTIIAAMDAIDGATSLIMTEVEAVVSPEEEEDVILPEGGEVVLPEEEEVTLPEETPVLSEGEVTQPDEELSAPVVPIVWRAWLIMGLVVVAVIGGAVWLILRRRVA
ncbi:hypothetical protein ACFLUJ_09500 [Chloroflexota bacterium]